MDVERIGLAKSCHRLSDLIRPSVRLSKASGGYSGLCPFHRETDPSFHVSDVRGTYKCFACGARGDVIDWVMQSKNMSLSAAVDDLLGSPLTGAFPFQTSGRADPEKAASDDETRRIRHAHSLWLKAEAPQGTSAEVYLRDTRNSTVLPGVLKFVPEAYCSLLGSTAPALMAPLQDGNGHVTAVQLVYLDLETGDAIRDDRGRRLKRTFGAMHDGAARLASPMTTLGLAGSVEDACAVMSLFSLPVWATCGEGRLGSVWIPPEIESVIILGDADAAGQAFAGLAKRQHARAGRRVTIELPPAGKDWAEYLAIKRTA